MREVASQAPGTITVRDLLRILRRRIWWVIIPLVLALGASAAGLYLMTPTYRATTTLMVITPPGSLVTYDTLLYNRTLAKTFVEVARSLGVARQAVTVLNQPIDPADLRERISVAVVRDTEVISIAVDDTNPELAANLANTVADVFELQFREYTTQASLRVIDPAPRPEQPVRPRPLLYTAVALASGVTAGVALAFLVEHLATPVPVAHIVPPPPPPASALAAKRFRSRRRSRRPTEDQE